MNKALLFPTIGIDFGTYKTTVSVWKKDHTEIIISEDEQRWLPTAVCYTENERLLGEITRAKVGANPGGIITSVKRFIGRKYFDPVVQKIKSFMHYKVVQGADDRPMVEVDYKGKNYFSMEQIASVILRKAKYMAEKVLMTEVKYAVLSAPPTFSLSQIEALKDAAMIAGLYISKVVNEASLAATEYATRRISDPNSRKVLIFNFGAGFLHLEVVKVQSGSCMVLAVGGNDIVGGDDVDHNIMQYCLNEFKKKTGINLQDNSKAMRKLAIYSEKAKKALSTNTETFIEIVKRFR